MCFISQLAWKLPDNEVMKKDVYMRMAVAFRKFRHELHNKFMKEDKTPFSLYTAITQEDWDIFVKYHILVFCEVDHDLLFDREVHLRLPPASSRRRPVSRACRRRR